MTGQFSACPSQVLGSAQVTPGADPGHPSIVVLPYAQGQRLDVHVTKQNSKAHAPSGRRDVHGDDGHVGVSLIAKAQDRKAHGRQQHVECRAPLRLWIGLWG